MGVTPLTDAQLAAIAALVAARRVEAVPIDARRVAAFLAAAEDRISQLPLLSSTRVKYDLAYDAAHDVGEALLAAYGYRTTNGSGQHEAQISRSCPRFAAGQRGGQALRPLAQDAESESLRSASDWGGRCESR